MPNRLIHEQSPYLLQHAQNPVDWYPWGDEAFAAARERQVPIFLSIGYSTCHWCHVMERESFENPDIAAILNRDFLPIKVDREERPDVDRIYMSYVQASTGGGGWPMSVWLTPDLKPFVGGTYFPPENRYGRAGFPAVLERIASAWRSDHDKIVESAHAVVQQLERQAAVTPTGAPDPASLDNGFLYFRRTFDSKLGGFGQAPKFPRPATFNFLLRYYAREQNEEALEMVLQTLQAMAKGGMNDQLGGGFHRYSVDEYWFVPHFEKMLYDQAQLAISYLEAFQITRDPLYASVARTILDYVLRDMLDVNGGFYSAEDADSVIDPAHPHEKGEGAFYIWSYAELEQLLGEEIARWFAFRFGAEPGGNVHNDPHQEFTGKNILFSAHSVEETAQHFNVKFEEMAAALAGAATTLLQARSKRVRPHLDDKVLTAWNGLMISAFAKGGAILQEERYTRAARRAADFIAGTMYQPENGILLRRYRQGDAAIPGFLDDYAFFVQGLLDLYESSFHPGDLDLALRLTEKQRELFEDQAGGGFYSTALGDDSLVMRLKEDYDGAEPSGNSIAVLNLLRLAGIAAKPEFQNAADKTLSAFAQRLSASPFGVPQMLAAYSFRLAKPTQIVFAGDRQNAAEMLQVLYSRFLPDTVILWAGDNPLTQAMAAQNGKTTVYLCENYTCQLPTTEPARFAELLQ